MTLGYSSLTWIFQSESSSLAKHLYSTSKKTKNPTTETHGNMAVYQ